MDASAVCSTMWERCEGLSALLKHVQLATAMSVSGHFYILPYYICIMQGCSAREGMAGMYTFASNFDS